MGRTTELTEDDIADAIKQIMRDGRRPSWEAVREEVGKGSPVVLNRMINEWFGINGPHLVERVPTGEQIAFDSYLEQATGKAIKKFEETQVERVSQLDARSATLDERERLLAERENGLDQREYGQRELIDHLHGQIRELKDSADRSMDIELAAKEELAEVTHALSEARRDIEQLGSKNAVLEDELQRKRDDIQRLQTHIESAEESVSSATKSIKQLLGQLELGRMATRDAQAALKSSDAALADQRALLEGERSRAAVLAAELEKARSINAELREHFSSQHQLLASIPRELQELGKANADNVSIAGKRHAELIGTLVDTGRHIEELASQQSGVTQQLNRIEENVKKREQRSQKSD